MRYNTQAQFDALVINRLHAATMDLRQSGQFNFAALKTLHDQAFEPSPHLPVEVRDMMRSYYEIRPDYDNWQKPRQVSRLPYPYLSMYSPLQAEDYLNAEQAIASARPDNMATLSFEQKIERLATVYAELDYLHAFWDGNSRVNRAFVQEMALASGVEFNYGAIDHNTMYVARDKSLAELNLTRRPEALKTIRYDYTNAHDGLSETLENLNKAYPEVSLTQVFAQVARPAALHQAQAQSTVRSGSEGNTIANTFYPSKDAVDKHFARLRGGRNDTQESTTADVHAVKYRPG